MKRSFPVDADGFKFLDTMSDLPVWEESTFIWNITNLSELVKETSSEVFECACAKWKLVLDLDGHVKTGYISVFLESVDADSDPQLGWHRNVEFVIAIVNTKNHAIGVHAPLSDSRREFKVNYPVGCWIDCIGLSKMESMEIIQDDAVTLIVELRVFKDDYTRPQVPSQNLVAEATALASKAAKLGYSLAWIPISFGTKYGEKIDFSDTSGDLDLYINCPVLADVELIINVNEFYGVIEKSFFAHKKTLAASSKYFEAMFNSESGFRESTEFTIKIQLPVALSSREFLLILENLYNLSVTTVGEEIDRSKVSKDPSLLRLIMVAEYLQMEILLEYLTLRIHKLNPTLFRSQVGWMSDTIFPYAVLASLFKMCKGQANALRVMLGWLGLTLSSPDRPHGWDTTEHGLKHLQQVIDTDIIPLAKLLPFNSLPATLQGLSDTLISRLRLDTIVLPAILSQIVRK